MLLHIALLERTAKMFVETVRTQNKSHAKFKAFAGSLVSRPEQI